MDKFNLGDQRIKRFTHKFLQNKYSIKGSRSIKNP